MIRAERGVESGGLGRISVMKLSTMSYNHVTRDSHCTSTVSETESRPACQIRHDCQTRGRHARIATTHCCHCDLRVLCSRSSAHPTCSASSRRRGVGRGGAGGGAAAEVTAAAVAAMPSALTRSPEHSPRRLHTLNASPTVERGRSCKQSRSDGTAAEPAAASSPAPAASGARVSVAAQIF